MPYVLRLKPNKPLGQRVRNKEVFDKMVEAKKEMISKGFAEHSRRITGNKLWQAVEGQEYKLLCKVVDQEVKWEPGVRL